MANPATYNVPFYHISKNQKHHQDNYSTTSQTQQEDYNKEIFKQNLEGAVITLFLIIAVVLCIAIYEKSKKIK